MNEQVVIWTMLPLGVALAVCSMWLTSYVDPRIKAWGALLGVAANVILMIMNVLLDSTVGAAFHAALAAVALWLWWNGGGGDGLKRRLKSWSQSLRRTFAPQTA